MKIILLKTINNLGETGQIIDVSPSFARNKLLKESLAIPATPEKIQDLFRQQAKQKKAAEIARLNLQKIANKLTTTKLHLPVKANAQGRLFSGIGAKQISAALLEAHQIQTDPSQILLKEPLKELGRYNINFKLSSDVTGEFSLELKTQGQ